MTPGSQIPSSGVIQIDAAAVADARAEFAPGSLLLDRSGGRTTVLAAGSPDEIGRSHPAPDARIRLPNSTLIPGMVNAHTHLDLTHMGPLAHDPSHGLTPWLHKVVAGRVHEPDEIADSVRQGIAKSLAGGVVAVGDIAGWTDHGPTLTPHRALAESRVVGTSYVEFFAIGPSEARRMEIMRAFMADHAAAFRDALASDTRLGLTPHAPYTVTRAAYDTCIEFARDFPLTTHLAESHAEREFIAAARGPKRDLLEAMNLWSESVAADIGVGAHPIEHLAPVLARAPWLVAHVNDADDAGIATLARTGTSVAYCPRSSAYFGADAEFGPHRYRDMLAAGVNVCLGTDSIVNLNTPDRIAVLDEMRLLVNRDGLDPATALAMGTTHGARALGLNPDAFTFDPGVELGGLVAIDDAPTLAAALSGSSAFRLLC
ncbi:MAG: amidohydrolase family protein [Phycisphaerales bacterium]